MRWYLDEDLEKVKGFTTYKKLEATKVSIHKKLLKCNLSIQQNAMQPVKSQQIIVLGLIPRTETEAEVMSWSFTGMHSQKQTFKRATDWKEKWDQGRSTPTTENSAYSIISSGFAVTLQDIPISAQNRAFVSPAALTDQPLQHSLGTQLPWSRTIPGRHSIESSQQMVLPASGRGALRPQTLHSLPLSTPTAWAEISAAYGQVRSICMQAYAFFFPKGDHNKKFFFLFL